MIGTVGKCVGRCREKGEGYVWGGEKEILGRLLRCERHLVPESCRWTRSCLSGEREGEGGRGLGGGGWETESE
jgi:hypothetical protein